jgi:putative membrane protein
MKVSPHVFIAVSIAAMFAVPVQAATTTPVPASAAPTTLPAEKPMASHPPTTQTAGESEMKPMPAAKPMKPMTSMKPMKPGTDKMPAMTGDPVVLGMLGAINQHEIDAAKQAESKKVSAPVMAYAKKMVAEHGENLAKTKSLGAMSNNADIQKMKMTQKNHLAEMGKKSGKAYEATYVDAMVSGHTEVLETIDTKLMPMATSDVVKKHLTDTRVHVAMHLEEAKTLQAAH